ncbi:nitrate regulatory gene2 protein-like isoform X1 [Neltuma alba]|uniref:nitrate regulatory gene2 protein-like isoform X1 n=2 Tax=Neltuma alba TaxID=207710 RepID=UPI0010A2FA21|nr:nitrate regulatory gene2 protein-like isoform X1 [Prosopis alba]
MKMGVASSKTEKNEPLRLCRDRKRFIKLAMDSRYDLVAAHVSYIQSLRNVGIALRRYAEAEVLIESSLSISDKTPSQSTYPSPSPSHTVDVSDSPLHNESPLTPSMPRLSYMRSGGPTAVTVRINPSINSYLDDQSSAFSMPPPPPPPPDSEPSWDFFDPAEDSESFRFVAHATDFGECEAEKADSTMVATIRNNSGGQYVECSDLSVASRRVEGCQQKFQKAGKEEELADNANGFAETVTEKDGLPKNEKAIDGKRKAVFEEREDPSEFITHRARDFLSSIKDIEHKFIRASESGREVSRMLEANKIRVQYCEARGKSSALDLVSALHLCWRRGSSLHSQEPAQKIISWKRTTSTRSTSSRNALAAASKEDIDDSGSDFIEEFCMIAGSHSSTLDRLYAWERKLYDEVKASELLQKVYDRKCEQLRHQYAKDQGAHVIDKTRTVVKDLHSRIRVAIRSVDSISKRIERMRDEELHPQLVELIHGLIRMWKAMLECHHAQFITISLAYHSRSSSGTLQGDARREILTHLLEEIECFGLSFANWINSHTSYIESLNAWLQNCILQPRSKSRRPFSPRRALAPPIFVLCRDWCAGIRSLPSEELSVAIKSFLSNLQQLIEQQDEQVDKQISLGQGSYEETESKMKEAEDDHNDKDTANLCCIHKSLSKVLERLTKFSEASLKMYEDIRQKNEAARNAYQSI